MPLFFLGTREWRNRQTRTVQVRVPVMEWGFNSPLAHDETADPLRICGFCFPWLLLVAPLVFRAPEAPAAVCAGGRRPAREPSALRASLGASPRSPARPRHRPRAPQPGPLVPPAASTLAALAVWMCCLVPAISHVIPLVIFQTMNLYRWYCNVLGRS